MFATLAEAEKAARMLGKIAGLAVTAVDRAGDEAVVLTSAGRVRDWEGVADLLDNAGTPEDDRAQTIAEARDWVRVARDTSPHLPTERTQALLNAVSRIVEVPE